MFEDLTVPVKNKEDPTSPTRPVPRRNFQSKTKKSEGITITCQKPTVKHGSNKIHKYNQFPKDTDIFLFKFDSIRVWSETTECIDFPGPHRRKSGPTWIIKVTVVSWDSWQYRDEKIHDHGSDRQGPPRVVGVWVPFFTGTEREPVRLFSESSSGLTC